MPYLPNAKVRIVGAGLTGIAAAFEAHRMGARDITLHDRHARLGGEAWPRQTHGLELRESPVSFGPPGDPLRALFEANGLEFDDFENVVGAVSPAPGGDISHRRDFAGPALRARDLQLNPLTGESLADRLRAYPADIGHALTSYCHHVLGAWLDQVHESAVDALGIRRVYPVDVDTAELAALKRSDPDADSLYGIPAAMWGRLSNLTASTPRGGLQAFLTQARHALDALDVRVVDTDLVAPHLAVQGRAAGETVVWAADPLPLFSACGLAPPAQTPRRVFTFIFKARYGSAAPVEVRNFTCDGVVTSLRLYESRGQSLIAADCIGEASDHDLRREIHRLLAGFPGGSLELREAVSMGVTARWDCPNVETARALRHLRSVLARREGDAVVSPVWEANSLADRYATIVTGLRQSLQPQAAVRAA